MTETSYEGVALGVESAWPAFVAGATDPLPLNPGAETPLDAKESAEPVRS